jgi:hypothetical protein
MPDTESIRIENRFYHGAVVIMGILMAGVMSWVGVECSHIPAIEVKLTNIETSMTEKTAWQTHELGQHDAQLIDHEKRIQRMEDEGSLHNGGAPVSR